MNKTGSKTNGSFFEEDGKLPEGTIQILGVPFSSNSSTIHATPDCSFVLYSLLDSYLKKNFQVITIMSSKSPTHYLSSMKKMRINYQNYSSKGQLIYLDLFSAPFDDLDFTSIPLSETTPPTYDETLSLNTLKRLSFDSSIPAIENLGSLAREIQGKINTSKFGGVCILFDTLNPLMDSFGAKDIEVLQFIQTMQELCSEIRNKKQEVKITKKEESEEDDYYDEDSDDSDDIAAMRARRGLAPKAETKKVEDTKEETRDNLVANLVFTFDMDLFLTNEDRIFYEEMIKGQSDYVVEVHANESGYSLDIDGTILIKKNTFDDFNMSKSQTKAKSKFKIKENLVDYFEYFTF